MADYHYYLNKKVILKVHLNNTINDTRELSYTGEIIDVDGETLTLNDKFNLRQVFSLDKITHISEVQEVK